DRLADGETVESAPDEDRRGIDREAQPETRGDDAGGTDDQTPRVTDAPAQGNRRERPATHCQRVQRGEPADEVLVVAQRYQIEIVDEEDDRDAEVRADGVGEDEPHSPMEAAHLPHVLP